MPLVAEFEGSRILSFDMDIREYRSNQKLHDGLTCPYCGQQMFFVKRQNSIPYFKHAASCTSKLERHPESMEHLAAKMWLYHAAQAHITKYPGAKPFVEYRMPNAGENGRIADVAIVYPSGFIHIWEAQISPITTELIEKRTQDYASVGADVCWVFGHKALTSAIRDWCMEEFGEVFCFTPLEPASRGEPNLYKGLPD